MAPPSAARVGDVVVELDVVAVPDGPEGVGEQAVAELGPRHLQLDLVDEAGGVAGAGRAE
jgi:hypothetical protein